MTGKSRRRRACAESRGKVRSRTGGVAEWAPELPAERREPSRTGRKLPPLTGRGYRPARRHGAGARTRMSEARQGAPQMGGTAEEAFRPRG